MTIRQTAFVLATMLALTSCEVDSAPTQTTAPPATTTVVASMPEAVTTVPATDSLALDVFAEPGLNAAPVIVFFHGGSWYTGNPANVAGFAEALSREGLVVYNATYRTGQQAGGFPQSYNDVACAISSARATAADHGGDPDRIYVAGHSAGAHLAATVILAGATFSEDCSFDGSSEVVGFIGLAGPYNTNDLAPLLAGWFGGTIEEVPDAFEAGYPFSYIDTASPVDTLLIHGTADELVPVSFTTDFADALSEAGWTPELALLDGITHGGLINESSNETLALIAGFTR